MEEPRGRGIFLQLEEPQDALVTRQEEILSKGREAENVDQPQQS